MPARQPIVVAWCSLVVALASGGLIFFDVYGRGSAANGVLEAVWPLITLHFGPVAVWAYRRLGRSALPGPSAGAATLRRPR